MKSGVQVRRLASALVGWAVCILRGLIVILIGRGITILATSALARMRAWNSKAKAFTISFDTSRLLASASFPMLQLQSNVLFRVKYVQLLVHFLLLAFLVILVGSCIVKGGIILGTELLSLHLVSLFLENVLSNLQTTSKMWFFGRWRVNDRWLDVDWLHVSLVFLFA